MVRIYIYAIIYLMAITNCYSQQILINELMSSNSITCADESGDFPDWIEIYNADTFAVNLANFGLSDDPDKPFKWRFPSVVIEPNNHLLIWASDKNYQLHTNFKIKSSGETLILSNSASSLLDRVDAVEIPADISYGRKPNGAENWLYFNNPTPGASNTTTGYMGITEEPEFVQPSGFYSYTPPLSIRNYDLHSTIYYTLDGSLPTATTGIRYTGHIYINGTAVVRARAYQENMMPSDITTSVYLVNEKITVPVVCLTTDPPNLWDEETGIFIQENIWEDWEKPAHIHFFEPDGKLGFAIDVGIKLYGGWTRNLPQKSLAIFARSEYGYSEIDYRLFPESPISQFEAIVLRNSGNDWNVTQFRDAFMTQLVAEAGLDIQAWRPCVVFINGEYWGVYNIREKINEHYLASHHLVNPENLDLLENDAWVIHGDADFYFSLLNFLNAQNIKQDENYNHVKTLVEIDNFIKYQVSQIYFDNTDWPGNNLKYWRPGTDNGRWRWILFDTDFGFALYDPNAYQHNTLEFALADDGADWPNPPWSTFLLRTLLKNRNFKNDFINYFADFINYYFHPDTVLKKIDMFQTIYEPDIPRHVEFWGSDMPTWYQNITILKNYALNRPVYMKYFLMKEFGLSAISKITLSANVENGGKIQINSLSISTFPWSGEYFNKIPIQIVAIPENNYYFSGWNGDISLNKDSLNIMLLNDIFITANFVKDTLAQSINEPAVQELSTTFFLAQNYPNPFNPTTTIRFQLAKSRRVVLNIYDVRGKKVTTLVDGFQDQGNHQIKFNATNLASGLYFYTLSVGDCVLTKKMILIH